MAQPQEGLQLLNLIDTSKKLANDANFPSLASLHNWLVSQYTRTTDTTINQLYTNVNQARTSIVTGLNAQTRYLDTETIPIQRAVEQQARSNVARTQSIVASAQNQITSGINQQIQSASVIGLGVIDDVIGKIGELIDSLKSSFRDISSSIINGISSVVSGLGREIIRVVNSVRASIREISNGIVEGLEAFGNWIHTSITQSITAMRDWIGSTIKSIETTITNVYRSVSSWVSGVYQTVQDGIKSAYRFTTETVDNIVKTVRTTIDNFLEWIQKVIADLQLFWEKEAIPWLRGAIASVLSGMLAASEWAQGILNLTDADIEALLSGDFNILEKAMMNAGKGITEVIKSSPLYSLIYAFAYLNHQIGLTFIPSQVAASRNAEISLGLTPPPFDLMRKAFFMGNIDQPDLINAMKLAGINRENAQKALSGLREIPTAGFVQEAYLRNEITEEQHDFYMRAHGFSDDDIEIFKILYFRLPPVSDLIRMSVREVFSPEIAQRFGQFEDYPEEFDRFARKVGLSSEWAKAYWAAHWDLPSPTMGFEMLHRGIIDSDTLKLLLRALDVMPFWRDKLIQLSYNPLTRVDVRRMYQLGVLNEEEVYRSYLDIGYSPENAKRLTEFTKRFSAPEDESELSEFRRLARSTYSAAYRRNVISRDEYISMLQGMGYVQDDAELLATLDDTAIAAQHDLFDQHDFNREYKSLVIKGYKSGILAVDDVRLILTDLGYTDLETAMQIQLIDTEYRMYIKNLVADKISELYITYTIDEQETHNYLNVFGFSPTEIERHIQEWNINRNLRTRKPSQSDMVRFYRAGYITAEQLANELRGMGYNERYIDMYARMYGD